MAIQHVGAGESGEGAARAEMRRMVRDGAVVGRWPLWVSRHGMGTCNLQTRGLIEHASKVVMSLPGGCHEAASQITVRLQPLSNSTVYISKIAIFWKRGRGRARSSSITCHIARYSPALPRR
jgi:hypothetical protein